MSSGCHSLQWLRKKKTDTNAQRNCNALFSFPLRCVAVTSGRVEELQHNTSVLLPYIPRCQLSFLLPRRVPPSQPPSCLVLRHKDTYRKHTSRRPLPATLLSPRSLYGCHDATTTENDIPCVHCSACTLLSKKPKICINFRPFTPHAIFNQVV